MTNQNTGHGHVFPRPDGMKARCGGPAMCSECAKDLQRKYASEVEASVPLSTYESAVKGRQDFRKAYIDARRLLKRFIDAWEGVPGHENMDRLCEIARGLSDDSSPTHEPIAEHHLQPRYVLEQIMNNSTDSWAKGVARTCLMGSPVKSGAPQYTVKQHGVDCPKVEHLGEGYLHAADDDRPYDVDGVTYCGRCHGWIDTIGRSCVRT